jgi:short-subunit dehydrogenase
VPSPREALQYFSAVVVTGGSSGIGKSFILLAANLKPELVFCNLSRRSPEVENTQGAQSNLNHFPCDLSRPDEVERAASAVMAFLAKEVPVGRVLLINNSGIGAFGAFPEPDLSRQLAMVDVNVRAVVDLTGRLLPLLRARGGAILNVASTVAFMPTAYAATYGASKAFLLHWSLALSEELRNSGVRVLAVCPGTTTTEFFRAAGLDGGGVAQRLSQSPDAVAATALRALAMGRSQVVSGWFNWFYAAVAARLPKPLASRLAAQFMGRRRRQPPGG